MDSTTPLVGLEASGRKYASRAGTRRLVVSLLLASDTCALLAATMLAGKARALVLDEILRYHLVQSTYVNVLKRYATAENAFRAVSFHEIALYMSAIWLFSMFVDRLYDLDRLSWGSGEFTRVARALSVGVVAFIMLTFVLNTPGLSRAWTLLAWLLAIAFVSAGRLAVRLGLRLARERGHLLRPTLVVGSNPEAAAIVEILRGNRGAGFVPIGCLASSQAERLELDWVADVPCLGSARDAVQVVRDQGVYAVVIASSAFDHDVLARIVAELRDSAVDVHVSSGLFEVLTSRVLVREICGVPLITVKGVSLSRWNQFVKRTFDLVIAWSAVLVGLPMWLLLVLAIKLDSRGPVFFRQARVGRGGAAFGMLKFRSMIDDADALLDQLVSENEASGPLFKMRDDPRVTRVGRFMRKFSIDEFPQLINVIRGEMSLVGPRPPLIHETEAYTDRHWRRMEVLPGMTGLWQVSGRSNLSFDDMVRLDIYYIENWSVGLDMALLLRTVPAVLFATGAY